MLELKLVKESLFLNVLEAIIDLVDVASVVFSSTGLKLQAVDTEHVAVITLLFPADDFQHYHCDENLSIGIPIDNMVLDSKYQAFVQMPSAEFMRVCKHLSNIGDDGHISVTEKGLSFFASGKSGFVHINYMQ
ncbi:hypothetical protein EJB05_08082, partial [Eragrostis curvula]